MSSSFPLASIAHSSQIDVCKPHINELIISLLAPTFRLLGRSVYLKRRHCVIPLLFWLCLLIKKNKTNGARWLKYAKLFWWFLQHIVRAKGRIQGVRTRMRGMHPPICHFQKCFQCVKFSIVLNLFDSDKPYTLSSGVARNFKRRGSRNFHMF